MIKLERTSVMNLENAMRGARNPMNSWGRMDSFYDENGEYKLGPNDLDLAKRLRKAGSDHRKFLRQVFVSVDVTAPLYWWKEADTYKVGTVRNRRQFNQHDAQNRQQTVFDGRFQLRPHDSRNTRIYGNSYRQAGGNPPALSGDEE